ncbi:unnamed protein product [Symbiodinium pilosum]|uniref:Uncharacterized protein n=1 Tax=Symbiodinium pilosum TaxID=2952 RepID=A0A812YC09_SYMPI|nr:unnamed protein product [Symbiodinium pilosum]
MLVFFVVFFFGHALTCASLCPSLWLDKVCVHQLDEPAKQRGIAALPNFIARSNRMLILWDKFYFERLWCGLEVSLFLENDGSLKQVDLMPLWMPPWLLSTMLVDLLCATMFQLREFMFSGWSTAYMPVIQQSLSQWLGRESGGTVFGTFFMVGLFAGLCYLPAAIPSMFSFVRKLHRHGLMLDQLEHFDVRRAKCTLESDRTYIEQEITKRFSAGSSGSLAKRAMRWPRQSTSGLERKLLSSPSNLSCSPGLERFNACVQGPLYDAVCDRIGHELHVPYHICLITFLPMMLLAAVNVFGCDDGPCDKSAKQSDSTLLQYMMQNTFGWVASLLLVFPAAHSLLLRLLKAVQTTDNLFSQVLRALVSGIVVYAYIWACFGLVLGAVASPFVGHFRPMWLLISAGIFAFLIWQAYMLFCTTRRPETIACSRFADTPF